MPRVRFTEADRTFEVEVPPGTTILQAARKCGAPEGSACGGVCACSTCHVYVVKGGASLSEMKDSENDILDKAFDVRPSSRLGCQAKVGAQDLEVQISGESVKAYYDEHPAAEAAAKTSGGHR